MKIRTISLHHAFLAFFTVLFILSSIYLVLAVSCNDNVNLALASTKLYYNDSLNKARLSLTKAELPTLLADGLVFIDNTGNNAVQYTQSLSIGSKKIEYGTSGGDIDDPTLIIELGAPTYIADKENERLYAIEISLARCINVSSLDLENKTIRILGTDYEIGRGSNNRTLYLHQNGRKVRKLTDGQRAKGGITETAIQGTLVNITQDIYAGNICGFKISIIKQKVLEDFVRLGWNFTDPVFWGFSNKICEYRPCSRFLPG